MTAGLGIDRLLDFLFDILYLLKFWVVIDEYERAVVLTFGKRRLWWFHRWFMSRKSPVLNPGFHFVLPFAFENVIRDNVVPCERGDLELNMTLKDATPLFVEFSFMWKIVDIEKFTLEVEDADSALVNVQGIVQEWLFQFTWEELMEFRKYAVEKSGRADLSDRLRTFTNREVKKWGVEIVDFYIQSFIRPELRSGVIKAL
jgi:regulator of protease activity HflC (stomatin/prohibitin superfamily)